MSFTRKQILNIRNTSEYQIYLKKLNAAISPLLRMAVNQTTLGIKHLFIEIVSKIKSLRNFPNTEPTSLQP